MATTKNFFLDQGSSFSYSFTAVDENNAILSITSGLSGVSASAQLRRSYYSSNYVSLNVSVTGGTGGVGINTTLGPTSSSALKPGRYVYDIELTVSPTRVIRQKQGVFNVDPEVTK